MYLNPGFCIEVGHCVARLNLRQHSLHILRHSLQCAEYNKIDTSLRNYDSAPQVWSSLQAGSNWRGKRTTNDLHC